LGDSCAINGPVAERRITAQREVNFVFICSGMIQWLGVAVT
jgi:hypothetical protein